MECIDKNIPPLIYDNILCNGQLRPLICIFKTPFFRFRRNKVSNLPWSIGIVNIIDPQTRMKIAAIQTVITILQVRMIMGFVNVMRPKRTVDPQTAVIEIFIRKVL